MKRTTERHSPDRVRTLEDRVTDALHRFAYAVVEDYAEPGDRLLEIGFGEGYGADIVRPWIGSYVGVEVDAGAVAHAQKHHRADSVTFLEYDGAALPFEEASFGLVISFQVLEHVQDPAAFLREARRVVRAGGVVLVATPNRNHRLDDGERPWNRYHVREFSPAELDAAMRDVFEEVEIFGIHGSKRMNTIERARVARARKLARLDPLGLRYRLPESLDTRLRAAVRRGSTTTAATDEAEVGVEHVRRDHEHADALDLLGVGRR